MDADENTAEMWMRNNECAIKKCGYKFAAASQGVTPSFCYEVVAKHGRIVIRSEVVIVCFKYGYIPWFVLTTVDDDDDAPPNWQVLRIKFPLAFKPLTEWAVFWHDLTMHEINGETAGFFGTWFGSCRRCSAESPSHLGRIALRRNVGACHGQRLAQARP